MEVPAAPPQWPRRKLVLIILAAAVALTASSVTYVVTRGQEPAEVVRAYLENVRAKNVKAALGNVAQSPYGFNASFMTADSIADDWEFGDVEVEFETSDEAEVSAEFTSDAGSESGLFRLRAIHGVWTLVNPFVEVEFPGSPTSYLQVNDEIVELPEVDAEGRRTRIKLFPGPYTFYRDIPDVVYVDRSSSKILVPKDSDDSGYDFGSELVSEYGTMTVTTAVTDNAQEAVAEYLDDCAEYTTLTPHDCPFGTNAEIYLGDGKYLDDVRNVEWTIEAYPDVSLMGMRQLESDESIEGFGVASAGAAVVTLTGVGTDDGKSEKFTQPCDIDLAAIAVRVSASGEVTVVERESDVYSCS